MSFFDIVQELNDIRLTDGPTLNTSTRQLGLGSSRTPGKGSSKNITPTRTSSDKTPTRCGERALNGNLSAKKHTPGNRTVNGNRSAKKKTPSTKGGDRFIPNRANTDLDFAHFCIMSQEDKDKSDPQGAVGGGEEGEDPNYVNQLSAALQCDAGKTTKILNFKSQVPQNARSVSDNLDVLYNCRKTTSKASASNRYINSQAERVLDAPNLMDDFYLNLLDWSNSNILSVALGQSVYLWNATTATIDDLLELNSPDDYISSVSWLHEGEVLAVGLSTGAVQLWDTDQKKMLRSMAGHAARVGCLSWNDHILSSGSKSGAIHHHDVRVAQHHVATLQNHTQEVCGLAWSPNKRYLASGSNDNLVNVWSGQMGGAANGPAIAPVHTFTQHRAAVKAIAWCPWQSHLLATGGGSADRQILMWNVSSGANVGVTNAGSQVSSLLWSQEYKELISGHGYATNHLRIWKYPTMTKVTDLMGHTARILCTTMSPDKTIVASAAGDETIRLWKCFEVDKTKKSASSKAAHKLPASSSLTRTMR